MGTSPSRSREEQELQNMDCCVGALVPVGILIASVALVWIASLLGLIEFRLIYSLPLQGVMLLIFSAGYMWFNRN